MKYSSILIPLSIIYLKIFRSENTTVMTEIFVNTRKLLSNSLNYNEPRKLSKAIKCRLHTYSTLSDEDHFSSDWMSLHDA